MSYIKVESISVPNFKSKASLGLSKKITFIMYNETMSVFNNEGPGWVSLKPVTIKQRVKNGFGSSPILNRKRGNLGLKGGIIEKPTKDSAIVGVRKGIEYAAIHQFGGIINRQPYSSSVFLRTDRKGKLLRQKNHNKLTVFAKKTHKLKVERKFTSTGYAIVIPQRKYLEFTPIIRDRITEIVNRHFTKK